MILAALTVPELRPSMEIGLMLLIGAYGACAAWAWKLWSQLDAAANPVLKPKQA